MSEISRYYDRLDRYLTPGKVLAIFGPRQVGKTTLLKHFLRQTTLRYRFETGSNIKVQEALGIPDLTALTRYVEGYELLVIDEAQQITNIGQSLKLLVDQIPKLQIIVTGSASFELAGQIGEPLTGRKTTLMLYPVSQLEMQKIFNRSELKEHLPEWLVFGSYPAVLTAPSIKAKRDALDEIVGSYLLKDILDLDRVKGSKLLLDMLRLLAFQVGSQVSLTEIGSSLGIDYKTVARYLDLFEKSFVLYNLRGYSRNLRNEITKTSKYYFYDNGIRNGIIANFNPVNLRDDIGPLWENFMVSERLKVQQYKRLYANNFFWRTWDQKEIDWLEERQGNLFGYEFKYRRRRKTPPPNFHLAYPNAKFSVISQYNYINFTTRCSSPKSHPI